MNRFTFFLFFVAIACTAPQQQTDSRIADSTIATDTIAVTADDTTHYELTQEELETMRGQGETAFNLAGSAGVGTLLNIDVMDVLRKAYHPDFLITGEGSADAEVMYTITSTEVIEGDFVNTNGECSSGAALLCVQALPSGEEEEYDLYFVRQKDNEVMVYNEATFTGSYAQTTASVNVSLEYKLSDHCPALAVEYGSEGGDIDLARDEAIALFIIKDDEFIKVLDLTLENTRVSEYEVSGDENKNSTSEVRTFEILNTTTKGLRDIKAHYIQKTDGEVTEEADELYVFNGTEYTRQLQ